MGQEKGLVFYLNGLKVRRHLLTIMERSPLFAIIAHARVSSACCQSAWRADFKEATFHFGVPLLVSDRDRNRETSLPESCLRNFTQRFHGGSGLAAGFGIWGKKKKRKKEKKRKKLYTDINRPKKESKTPNFNHHPWLHLLTPPSQCREILLRCAGSERSLGNWPTFSSFQPQLSPCASVSSGAT